jgi:uncharacterized protein (TIGR02172 family)
MDKNMEITLHGDNGKVMLTFDGRLETGTVAQATEDIGRLLGGQQEIEGLTCDFNNMSYISSSGLRLVLQLAKKYENFCIIGTQPDVYQVFEMTGFTQMMMIERAYRQVCVDGCEEIGRGGVGVVYRLDDETIIKVFRKGSTIDELRAEIFMAKDAFVLGMPTAISYDIVRVGDCYGLVYELLNTDTLGTCIMREPERMDEFARLYANLFRQLHEIHVPKGGRIPNALERVEAAVRHISRYFDSASIDLLLEIVHKLPDGDSLLHCDLQTKNALMQGNELMLIDMGEVCYGHPMIDLGYAYSSMIKMLGGDYESLIGMPREYGRQLWKKMMGYYFEGASDELLAHREAQLDVVATVRNFNWLALSDNFPESAIRECQQAFDERVTKRKDYLLSVCETFGDWE